MSFAGCSLLSLKEVSLREVAALFSLAKKIKINFEENDYFFSSNVLNHLKGKVVANAFFEPSSRTMMSFQMACQRIQLPYINLPSRKDSSLVKGETLVDTVMNLKALRPDLLVIRFNHSIELSEYLQTLDCPVINAGSGITGHPTQALLDVFTMLEHFPSLAGQKILFVGDVAHSRVAVSNLEILRLFEVEIGFCCPEFMKPSGEMWDSLNYFSDLAKGLEWATVCMGLRVQVERHQAVEKFDPRAYAQNYCINLEKIKSLRSEALIMHPGPFVRDLDFSHEVLSDSRCVIEEQVTNGVYVRAALLASRLCSDQMLLDEEVIGKKV